MNTKNIFLSFATLLVMLFSACNNEAQNKQNQATAAKNSKAEGIEIIQFHSEHRCMTCNKIEKLTREMLKTNPSIPFSLVNVDNPKNEQKANEFEAAGTSLFLYNSKTGAKKNLTDFAFMNAGNEKVFIEGLQKELNQFSKL